MELLEAFPVTDPWVMPEFEQDALNPAVDADYKPGSFRAVKRPAQGEVDLLRKILQMWLDYGSCGCKGPHLDECPYIATHVYFTNLEHEESEK